MSYEIAKKLMAEHTGLKKAVEAFLTIQSFAPGANLVAVKTAILAAVRRRDSLVKDLGYPGDLLDYEIKKWDANNKELLDSFAVKEATVTAPQPATPAAPVTNTPPAAPVEVVEVEEVTDLDEQLKQAIQEAIPEEAELVEGA